MFLNFEDEEKELEHQYQIIATLEIIDYKMIIKIPITKHLFPK